MPRMNRGQDERERGTYDIEKRVAASGDGSD